MVDEGEKKKDNMRILNLYAGIGGNRNLWTKDYDCTITAVEYDKDIMYAYNTMYPYDTCICADAHEYLLKNYHRFDFIWSSPPCQTHSRMRYHLGVTSKGHEMKYPDFRLYEEILFLQKHAKCKWVVENVIPWYEPLIKPTKQINRHFYRSNFELSNCQMPKENLRAIQIPDLEKLHGIYLPKSLKNKRQILRNCVSPKVGLSIYEDFIKSLTRAFKNI